jgi:DNA-binding NarL/FixJ family response regulator
VETPAIRVLVVDDYEPWRRFVHSTLQKASELRVIGEASDGLEAIQKAEGTQPDLILLDIGLPKLNGIEAASRIRGLVPFSKIIFVSDTRSPDIMSVALRAGGSGYVVKSNGATELLPAIAAVLEGKQFVSADLGVATPARLA